MMARSMRDRELDHYFCYVFILDSQKDFLNFQLMTIRVLEELIYDMMGQVW